MFRDELLFHFADWLTDPPSGGRVQMWFAGGMIAALFFVYGLACCVTGEATTLNVTLRGFRGLGRGVFLNVQGQNAVSLGLVFVFVGLFTHFQWFWGNHRRLVDFYEFGKYAAIIGVIASTAWHVVSMFATT